MHATPAWRIAIRTISNIAIYDIIYKKSSYGSSVEQSATQSRLLPCSYDVKGVEAIGFRFDEQL